MPRHCRFAVVELRRTIDGLPTRTREAMLEGIGRSTVITGADTDRNGGVCPMLAAHRLGARANFAAFAASWDRFTGVGGRQICRKATRAELDVLVAQLEGSLSDAAVQSDLGAAIAAHQELTRGRRRTERPPVDLAAAIAEHQSLSRARREREAAHVGIDWLRDDDAKPVLIPRRLARGSLLTA